MTNKKKTKDNHLKFRASEKDNTEITLNAQYLNMNKSEYVRLCCLSNINMTTNTIPNSIKTANLLNDIVDYLKTHAEPETVTAIERKISAYYRGGKYYGRKKK